MKTKVKRLSKRTLAIFLGVLMLVTSIGLGSIITANAYDITANKLFFINKDNWTQPYLGIQKKDTSSTDDLEFYALTNISGTKVYYRSSNWNGYHRFGFTNSSTKQFWSGTYYGESVSSGKVWWGDSSSGSTDSSKMDSSAKVVVMIDSGSGYTKTANADCVATISGVKMNGFNTSTTATSASTDGSNSEKSINVAYGSTITYTAADSGSYKFMGFSTTNSSSLPSSPQNSGYTRTASGYNGTANTTVYAYFKLNNYSVTTSVDSGSGTSYISTSSPVTGTSTSVNVTGSSTVYVKATPSTGYQWSSFSPTPSSSSTSSGVVTGTFSVSGATDIKSNFSKISYPFTDSTSAGGSISLSGGSDSTHYQIENAISFTTNADDHYTYQANSIQYSFDNGTNWSNYTDGSTITIDEAKCTANGIKVRATFNKNDYGVSVAGKYSTTYPLNYNTDMPSNSVVITSNTATYQDGVTITAYDREGYTFVDWIVTNGTIENETAIAGGHQALLKPTSNGAIATARYKKNYTVTASVAGGTGGSVSPDTAQSMVTAGTKNFTFTPTAGYALSSITINGGSNILSDLKTSAYEYTYRATGTDATVSIVGTFQPYVTVSATKKGEGASSGRFTINGSSSASNSSLSKNVVSGSTVTFTADDSSADFAGWYSDASCTTLLTKELTYTATPTSDLTVYPAFNYSNYYLCGSICFADWYNDQINSSANINATTRDYEFTQSASDPRLYTYTGDFRFATHESDVITQYVTVSNGSNAYKTASPNAASGTAASDFGSMTTSEIGDTNKWLCDAGLDNCYKRVTFTWNAVTKELSWTYTDVDYDDYVVMYVNASDGKYWDYLYLTDGNEIFSGGWPGVNILCTPYIVVDGTTYNIVLISNSRITGNNKLNCILSNRSTGEGNQSANITGMEKGKSYKVEFTTTPGTPEEFNPIQYNIVVNTSGTGGATATSDVESACEEDTVTITAAPDAGKYTVITVTGGMTANNIAVTRESSSSFTFKMPDEDVLVNVSYADKISSQVKSVTNDSELGTVKANTTDNSGTAATDITAEVDSTVHVYTTAVAGALDKLTVKGASGSVEVTTVTEGHYTFLMPPEKVTVTATFDNAPVDFWYDGYQRKSGNDSEVEKVDDASNIQFKKGSFNNGGTAQEYYYAKIERDDTDPRTDLHKMEFVVKTDTAATIGGSSGKYVYFKGYGGGWINNMPNFQVKFLSGASGNSTLQDWTGMDGVTDKAGEYKIQKKVVPDGATYVMFRTNDSAKLTSNKVALGEGCFMCNTSNGNENPARWTDGESTYADHYSSSAPSTPSATGDVWTYSSSSASKKLHDGTTATYRYIEGTSTDNISDNIVTGGAFSDTYALHDENNSYYVIILKPNVNYGKLHEDYSGNVGSQTYYRIYASELLPGEEDPYKLKYVDLYIKNGCLRDSTYNRFTNIANTDVVSITYNNVTGSTTIPLTESNASISGGNYGDSVDTRTYTNASYTRDKTGYDSNYDTLLSVPVGAKIKLRTYLSGNSSADGSFDGEAFKDTHYLKGYSINGMTYKIHKYSDGSTDSTATAYRNPFASGTPRYYEEEWTVKDVNTANMKDGKTIEITPIYYMKDNSDCKTFYIDGYEGDIQTAWGTMLAVYPYYKNVYNDDNAYGGYPGQPMLYWGGKYQTEVPLTDDGTVTGKEVQGMTLHNAYWDLLHRSLDTKCDDQHRQTYDYDDFYKLYREKETTEAIYFRFEYRNKHDNFGDEGDDRDNLSFGGSSASAATYAGSDYNGVSVVEDFFDRQVDVFGNLISSTNRSDYETTSVQDKELLLVSNGYKNTYEGKYATVWAVYAPQSSIPEGSNDTAGKFIGYISSSMLYLNNLNSVNHYADGTNTAQGKMSWSGFTDTYEHLKKYYEGVPALISYEKEIENTTGDVAYRSDGHWFYSDGTEQVESNVKIQYTNKTSSNAPSISSDEWVDDEFDTVNAGYKNKYNIGSVTGCQAYFTNTTPKYLVGETDSGVVTVDPEKEFTFETKSAGEYEFVGWVRYSNGKYYELSDKTSASSNISANDTYIARYAKAARGNLVISHNVVTNGTYKGTGSKLLTVEVYDGDPDGGGSLVETIAADVADGSDVDVSKYISSKLRKYYIKVSLTTTADEDCTIHHRTCSSDTFKTTGTPTSGTAQTVSFSVADVLSEGVTAIRYNTYLTKTEFNYKYEITYNYTSRFWGAQSFKVTGDIDESEADRYFTGKKGDARLKDDFIEEKTPYEKNFRETINWNYSGATKSSAAVAGQDNTYKLTATVGVSGTVNDKVKAKLVLPYKYATDTKDGSTTVYSNKAAQTMDEYSSPDPNPETASTTGNTAYVMDDSYDAIELDTQVGQLFQYDHSTSNVTENDTSDNYKLVDAAPYILKDVDFHYTYQNDSYFNSYTGKYTHSFDGAAARELDENDTVSDATVLANFGLPSTTLTKAVYVEEGNSQKIIVQDHEDAYKIYTRSSTKDGYVTNENTKKYYFTRWDIYSTSGEYIASSFYTHFNFSGYQDYVAYPIYETLREGDSPAGAQLHTGKEATISLIDTSRNQWNVTNNDNPSDCKTYGDKIFTDFALSFKDGGAKIQADGSMNIKSNYKVGFIIERLDKVELLDGGSVTGLGQKANINDSYYAKKYNSGITSAYTTSVKDYVYNKINGNSATKPTGSGAALYCPATSIDNFNRLHYTYTFTQRDKDYNWSQDTKKLRTQGQYVYRATAYIYNTEDGDSADNITLSAPIYFNLYDIASKKEG